VYNELSGKFNSSFFKAEVSKLGKVVIHRSAEKVGEEVEGVRD
jgi:hypothetical protein